MIFTNCALILRWTCRKKASSEKSEEPFKPAIKSSENWDDEAAEDEKAKKEVEGEETKDEPEKMEDDCIENNNTESKEVSAEKGMMVFIFIFKSKKQSM